MRRREVVGHWSSPPRFRQSSSASCTFVPFGDGSERATIDGGEVNIDEREVDPALNFLVLKKRQQQEQSSQ
jgi:hypothetical protein